MVCQRRLQRVIEQVLDGEALGVVGAGRLALAGGVMQVDFAFAPTTIRSLSCSAGTYKSVFAKMRRSVCASDSSLCSKPS